MNILELYLALSQNFDIPETELKALEITQSDLKLVKEQGTINETREQIVAKLQKTLSSFSLTNIENTIKFEDYIKLLSIVRMAYSREKNGVPEEHAAKLLLAFGNYDAAIAYLKRYQSTFPSRPQLIHDACLFSLPKEGFSMQLWQTLAKRHMPNTDFEKIYSNAHKIEVYVKDNSAKLEETARLKVLKNAELRFDEEWKKKQSMDHKSLPDLKTYIEQKIQKEGKKIQQVVNKKLSHLLIQKLRQSGQIKSENKLSPEELQILKSYQASEEAANLKEEIIKQITDEWKINLEKEYQSLTQNNICKKDYIQSRMKEEKAIIEGNINDAIKNLLSEHTSILILLDYMAHTSYKRSSENEFAAALFFEHGIPEEEFEKYLNLKPSEESNIPDIFIDGDTIGYPGFYLKKLSSKDPRAAILGKMTSCCQSLGDAGEKCTIHGITNKESGFYVLCQRKGDKPSDNDPIFAETWVWNGNNRRIVFDSIESQIDFRKRNEGMVTDFFAFLAYKMTYEKAVPEVLLGNGATPDSLKLMQPLKREFPRYYPVGYRDSTSEQYILGIQSPFFMMLYLQNNPNSHLKKIIGDFVSSIEPTKKQILEWIECCAFNQKPDLLKLIRDQVNFPNLEQIIKEHFELTSSFITALNKKDRMGIKKAAELFKLGANIELDQSISGGTLLQSAVRRQDLSLVQDLVENGANINSQDNHGNTSLHYAIRRKQIHIIKYLIQKCPSVSNALNSFGHDALLAAIETDDVQLVEYFIGIGADVNKTDFLNRTALMNVVRSKNLEMVKLLIKNKADCSITSTENEGTAMEQSLHLQQKFEIAQFFVDVGLLDVNHFLEKYSFLERFYIRKEDNDEQPILEFLLKNGANVNKTDKNGDSVLYASIKKSSLLNVSILLNYGADVNKINPTLDESPLFTALSSLKEKESFEIIQLLVAKGSDVNWMQKETGTTILHKACQIPLNSEILEKLVIFLIQNGADVTKRDRDGKMPLDYLENEIKAKIQNYI